MKGDYQRQREAGEWVKRAADLRCFGLTFLIRNSHEDRKLLERSDGPKGARKEGMGRQGHQEVSQDRFPRPTSGVQPTSRALVIGGFCRFIKGFITRHQPLCTDNSEYLAYVRHSYLTRLRENLPKTVLEKDSWLTPPPIMQEVRHSYQ